MCRVSSVSFCRKRENIRQNLDRLYIPHACRNLPVGRNARVGDIHFDDGRRDARRLDRLDLLDAGKRPLDQVGRLEGHAVARAMLDLLPQRLKILAQMDFLAELQLASVARVDDAVLEDLAVDLVDDLGREVRKFRRHLQFEMRILRDRTCRECRQRH